MASHGSAELADAPTGVVHGVFDGDEVVVVGVEAVEAVHAWSRGGFGELLHGLIAPAAGAAASFSLHLSPVEAFFLVFEQPPRLRVLDGRSGERAPAGGGDAPADAEPTGPAASSAADDDGAMGVQACWDAFRSATPEFARTYAVYRALRAAGWHLRDGLKFGVDFALYDPSGSPGAHAEFAALLVGVDASAERSWLWLQRHLRVCRTVAKKLLLCSVGPARGESLDEATPGCLECLPVEMVEMDTWSAGKEHAKQSREPGRRKESKLTEEGGGPGSVARDAPG